MSDHPKVDTAIYNLIRKIIKQNPLLGYFLAAGSGMLVQYIVGSTICMKIFNISFKTSILIGFIASIPVGFVLTKILAFDSRKSGNTNRELTKFFIVLFFSGLITMYGASFCLYIFTKLLTTKEVTVPILNFKFNPIGTISHFGGMGISFVFNYIVHKRFTFTETGIYDKVKGFRD